MMRKPVLACALAACLSAAGLAAPDARAAPAVPRVLPVQDVTVTYQVSGAAAEAIPGLNSAGGPATLRLLWSAGQNRLMVTQPGRPQRLLVNLPAHQATVLDDAMHAALLLPMRDADVQAVTMANARFTRRGQETVASESCTDWAVQAGRSAGTVCLTEQGVLLRGEGDVNGRHGAFVATAVDHGRVDPAYVASPPNYNRIELPRFGGG